LHIPRNLTNFPSIFSKSSQISSSIFDPNFTNSSSNWIILFDSCSMSLDLQLFWWISGRTFKNKDCCKLAQQWHLASSSNWSIFELRHELHSSSYTSTSICFGKLRAKASRTTSAISKVQKFESHHFLNCHMRFVVHSS
jgi:hypothetical protein